MLALKNRRLCVRRVRNAFRAAYVDSGCGGGGLSPYVMSGSDASGSPGLGRDHRTARVVTKRFCRRAARARGKPNVPGRRVRDTRCTRLRRNSSGARGTGGVVPYAAAEGVGRIVARSSRGSWAGRTCPVGTRWAVFSAVTTPKPLAPRWRAIGPRPPLHRRRRHHHRDRRDRRLRCRRVRSVRTRTPSPHVRITQFESVTPPSCLILFLLLLLLYYDIKSDALVVLLHRVCIYIAFVYIKCYISAFVWRGEEKRSRTFFLTCIYLYTYIYIYTFIY